jgi:hypothetical protein
VRDWAHAEDGPTQRYRDAHVWYDAESKQNFTAHRPLIADAVDGILKAVPRGVMAAGAIMQGGHGGIDIPQGDIVPGGSSPRLGVVLGEVALHSSHN